MALSVGGTIDRLRDWLLGFTNVKNPLRWLGWLLAALSFVLDSSMVTAFFVGAFWNLGTAPWREILQLGGIAALATYAADLALSVVNGMTMLITRGATRPVQSAPMPQPRQEEPKTAEDKVWEMIDEEEESGVPISRERGGIITN